PLVDVDLVAPVAVELGLARRIAQAGYEVPQPGAVATRPELEMRRCPVRGQGGAAGNVVRIGSLGGGRAPFGTDNRGAVAAPEAGDALDREPLRLFRLRELPEVVQ